MQFSTEDYEELSILESAEGLEPDELDPFEDGVTGEVVLLDIMQLEDEDLELL